MSAVPPDADADPQLRRKRSNTRRRLLESAFDVFAAKGFGQTTVHDVCDAAGFTRGAFYSNFTSLDELYLEMWQQYSDGLVAQIGEIGNALATTGPVSIETLVRAVDEGLGFDPSWFQLSTEFTAIAGRKPAVLALLRAQEQKVQAALAPVLRSLLAGSGRTAVDDAELCAAVVAVHDGTLVQCMIEEDVALARARRVRLLTNTIEAYTV